MANWEIQWSKIVCFLFEGQQQPLHENAVLYHVKWKKTTVISLLVFDIKLCIFSFVTEKQKRKRHLMAFWGQLGLVWTLFFVCLLFIVVKVLEFLDTTRLFYCCHAAEKCQQNFFCPFQMLRILHSRVIHHLHSSRIFKVECSGKRLMQWYVGKFEDFENHFRIKYSCPTIWVASWNFTRF
jgi:lipid-A-disaccharide synthase-like uncharacterized protein